MKILKYLLITIVILASLAAIAWFGFLKPAPPAISAEDRAAITLMPLPAKLELRGGELLLDSDLRAEFTKGSTERVQKALDRFAKRLQEKTGRKISENGEKTLEIILENTISKPYPQFGEEESYTLEITTSKISLQAKTEWGILHGLETLAQLVQSSQEKALIQTLEIEDQPRFPWRGLMIDVARHFSPKEVILRNLEAMAASKLNILHLHLSDFQGFRVESKKYPKLHELGSNGEYFTQDDIREIVQFASDRGIRVVPEFDVPGHTTALLLGHPEISSGPAPEHLTPDVGADIHVIDPSNEASYVFLDGLVEEMGALFPDTYFHIGGDEVNPTRWKESEAIQSFMKEKSLENTKDLQAYFNNRLFAILKKHGKRMSGWDEIINPELPAKEITIQAWRNTKSLWDAARGGYESILSSGYYLDHKLSSKTTYENDPLKIPGAVEIEVDSTLWKSYDLEISVQDALLEGELYLFGEGDKLRGILSFMNNPMGFETARMEGDKLSFSSEIPMGTFKNEYNIQGDSLSGEASLALFTFEVHGKKSGGSDFPEGKPLPKFDKIVPLTPEEEKNIIGGEAAMWTEMANARSLESRIWPRAAVVGEKLWSPQELTAEVPDMYRRLGLMDSYLTSLSLKHGSAGLEILKQLTEEPYLTPLTELVSILQEDVLFNRMSLYPDGILTSNPLDKVVDAALPESLKAYQFNESVASYLAQPSDSQKAQLISQLEIWAQLNEKLQPSYASHEKIAEVAEQAKNLEKLSLLALQRLKGQKPDSENEDLKTLLAESAKGYGGTLLAVHQGLQQLITQ